jgi:hypothetical protein
MPSNLSLRAEDRSLAFKFELPLASSSRLSFRAPFRVSTLEFSRTEHVQEGSPRKVSTLREGKVYFEELNDTKVDLREGQLVDLTIAHGAVEMAYAQDGLLYVRFRGTVSGLGVGTAGESRNLMPSSLRYWTNHPSRSLIYSTVSAIFILAVAAWHWWSTRR